VLLLYYSDQFLGTTQLNLKHANKNIQKAFCFHRKERKTLEVGKKTTKNNFSELRSKKLFFF
jgi:hypothetical protein